MGIKLTDIAYFSVFAALIASNYLMCHGCSPYDLTTQIEIESCLRSFNEGNKTIELPLVNDTLNCTCIKVN